MKTKLLIACGADDNFAMQLWVMLASLVQTQPQGTTFHFYLMDGGISEPNKNKISQLLRKKEGVTFEWLVIDQARLEGMLVNPMIPHLSSATLMRLLLPELVPGVERLLYIDADVLVNGNITPFYSSDFQGKHVVGVSDFWHPYLEYIATEEPTIPAHSPCFNAGVIVMNLPRFRESGLVERAWDLLKKHTSWSDQEALNVILVDEWVSAFFGYNLQSGWANLKAMPDCPVKKEMQAYTGNLLNDAAIIHFTGAWKPWSPSWRHPVRTLYDQRVAESGWFTPDSFVAWKRERFWNTIQTRLFKSQKR